MEASRLERDVRILKVYAAVLTVACVASLSHTLLAQDQKPHFAEIDVERINVVETDGRLRMVISNQQRQHPGILRGQPIARPQGRPPGLIFFDQRGDEMGGLIFGDNGGKGHFGQFTWDKVDGDQTIGFRHLESDSGAYESGIEVWQRPSGASRLFFGKRRDDSSVVELSDLEGKPRIRLRVAADGASALEFLDAQGNVIRRVP